MESNPGESGSNRKITLKTSSVIIGAVVGVITVPYTLMGIYDWFTKSSGPSFVVTATESTFALPPALWKMIDTVASSDDGDGPKFERDWLNYYVLVTIRNAGDLPADDVRLVIGSEGSRGIAAIERSDGRTEAFEYISSINVGKLSIEEVVKVSFWPRIGRPDDLLLTHSTGRKDFSIRNSTFLRDAILYTTLIGLLVMSVWREFALKHRFADYVQYMESMSHDRNGSRRRYRPDNN